MRKIFCKDMDMEVGDKPSQGRYRVLEECVIITCLEWRLAETVGHQARYCTATHSALYVPLCTFLFLPPLLVCLRSSLYRLQQSRHRTDRQSTFAH